MDTELILKTLKMLSEEGAVYPSKLEIPTGVLGGEAATTTMPGLSLRDHFAAVALPHMIPAVEKYPGNQAELAASYAYDIADAIVAERARRLKARYFPETKTT